MDAEHDTGSEQRHAQEGAEQRLVTPAACLAGNGGEQQFALGIVVIDTRQQGRTIQVEAETIAAFNFAEGRHVELLAGTQHLAITQNATAARQMARQNRMGRSMGYSGVGTRQ